MVAFRRGAALAGTAYLLGIIFLAVPVVHPILFGGKATNADYDRVERYFGAWWEAPPSVKLLLHADIALCILAVVSKFVTYTEQAWYFDGGSLVLLVIAIAFYISSLMPALRMLHPHSLPSAGPVAGFFLRQAKHEAAKMVAPKSEAAQVPPLTPPERKETIAIACASIVLIGVLLIGVVLLQIGEWYAVREERRLQAEARKKE